MLELKQVHSRYGNSQVLFGIDLTIAPGETVALLGRNGMGKSTTVKSIMGLVSASQGDISFQKHVLNGLPPHAIARLGIGLVPEGRQIFATLTVEENLTATSANRRRDRTPWTLARIYALFPRLEERRMQRASTLSGGEQQMLAIGRALLTNPDLLILDEATEGLAPMICAEIWTCLALLKEEGMALLVVDKDLRALTNLATRFYVLEKGRIVWVGTSADLQRDPSVVERYTAL